MEQSPYVDVTLELTEELQRRFPGVGVCLQAYLHRTRDDLRRMLRDRRRRAAGEGRVSRAAVAWRSRRRRDVDANYSRSAARCSTTGRAAAVAACLRHARHADHRRACASTPRDAHVPPGRYEFHMLYGIQRGEQARLAAAREHVRVLIAYGTYWFPWYMRRLAERPANVWFVVKSVFG